MLLFLDIETTGLNPDTEDLWELSAVRWDGKKAVATFSSLIAPDRDDFSFPPFIKKLCGVTEEDLRGQPLLHEVRDVFMKKFIKPDDIIVGHNISFDTGFLKKKGFPLDHEEIDTYPLATIVLPDEESHSLEVLTKKYDIEHEGAHRALADVLANIDLWKFLARRYEEDFSRETKKDIRDVLSRSTWSGAYFFTQARTEKKKNPSPPSLFDLKKPLLSGDDEKTEEALRFREDVCSLLSEGRKALWEICPKFPTDLLILATEAAACFSARTGKKIGVAFHTRDFQKIESLLEELSTAYHPGFATIMRSPKMMICETKWEVFQKKEVFSDPETKVAIKVIRDYGRGKHELPNLKHEEWSAAGSVSDEFHRDCPDSCPGKSCLPDVLMSQHSLFFIPHRNISSFPGEHLLLLNADNLEDIMTKATESSSGTGKIKSLLALLPQKIRDEIVFSLDLLGAFLRRQVEGNEYLMNIPVTPELRRMKDWKEFGSAFEDLLSLHEGGSFSDDLVHELRFIRDFFSTENKENEVQYFQLTPSDEVTCVRAIVDLDEALGTFFRPYSSLLLIGSYFPKTASGQWAFPFHVPEDWEVLTSFLGKRPSESFLGFYVPDGLHDADNTPKKSGEWLLEIIKAGPGNILAHFPSQRTIEAVEDFLIPECQKRNIILLSNRSGSAAKIGSLLLSPGRKVLLGTSALFSGIFPLPACPFPIMFFQKFQFDPPGSPLMEERKKLFSNAFSDYILPKSIGRFERELYRLFEFQGEKYSFFCFDTRILEGRGFGGVYRKSLPEGLDIRSLVPEELGEVFP